MKRSICWALPLLGALLTGCPPPPQPPPPPTPPVPTATAPVDNARPTLSAPKPFKAPTAEVYETASGIKVWLVARKGLPIVSLRMAIPTGSADDPPGKGGLAHITASMMDEGAGNRDALAISTELNDLGASLSTTVERDGSRIGVTVLTKHLDAAFPIFADVIARPTFDPKEYKRVSDLWHTSLKRREDNPAAVAQVVRYAVLYGPDTPYGHPTGGLLDTAKAITLNDVKKRHRSAWRPDQAMLVAVGDIDRARLDGLISKHLGDWKAPKEPAPSRVAPPQPLASRPKMVLVDRPDAPQAQIVLCAPGVAAADPKAPLLDLINTALGGSFTSRLNQNLREDHGWTYGARSSFVELLGVAPFVARAAVFTKVTAPALKEMLGEIARLAADGLTAEELRKVRAQDLTDMIQTNQTVNGLSSRLTDLAILGLAPDFDAKASEARQAASPAALAGLGKEHLDTSSATIVVVGPKQELLPQLKALDRGTPELWTAEGRPAP